MTPALLAVLALLHPAPAQDAEPMVIYGYAVGDAGDSAFVRLEFSGPPQAPEIRLAPFGRSPIPFDGVSLAPDTSTIRWVWPGRVYDRCELERAGEYHWEGACRAAGAVPPEGAGPVREPPAAAERRIVLGGGYVPDLGQDLGAGETDLEIIDRAAALLRTEEDWNRADERVCEDDARSGRVSLFCALYLASVEVTGEYLHRRPAMNVPREVIWERASGRITAHQLMDFNNHEDTSFREIHAVLTEAHGRLARAVRPSGPRDGDRQLIVVPTLGTEHQFDLDYTVAHLEALLEAIEPDAILVEDVTEWLANGCLWSATAPENHVALRYAVAAGIPILGTAERASPTAHERAMRTEEEYRELGVDDAREAFRPRLDATAAMIARDYSFAAHAPGLRRLADGGFAAKAAAWTPDQRAQIERRGAELADSLRSRIGAHPDRSRWAALLWWGFALPVEDSLRARGELRVVDVEEYLPIDPAAVERHLDAGNLAWILSGVLDEWYGMWAPQAFPGERISDLLGRLEDLAPEDPATRFLRARWLMRHRDFAAAEALLRELVRDARDARFPFPLNGKWIRPPWSSVARKARLNLAFIHDYRGERDSALALYSELLALGDELNREARAAGFIYDDIRRVIESYTVTPYSGMPEEAFRHFPLTSGIPACAPGRAAPAGGR